MLFNPVREALRDGFRCIARFKRIWLTFVLLGLGYSFFQFATFSPIESSNDFDLNQVVSVPSWHWPRLAEVWTEVPLPVLEGVAGIFDNATTTYPLSVVAAILMIMNWRGLHRALWSDVARRYPIVGYLIYLVLLLERVRVLVKPIDIWELPRLGGLVPAVRLLQISATVDAVAFSSSNISSAFIFRFISSRSVWFG